MSSLACTYYVLDNLGFNNLPWYPTSTSNLRSGALRELFDIGLAYSVLIT